jgi:hypothetical protein
MSRGWSKLLILVAIKVVAACARIYWVGGLFAPVYIEKPARFFLMTAVAQPYISRLGVRNEGGSGHRY